MKWPNLINRIYGLIFLLLAGLTPFYAWALKDENIPPLLLHKCWSVDSSEMTTRLFASDNDNKIYISKTGSKVEALDRSSGSRVWRTDLGGEVVSDVLGDLTNLFFITNSSSESVSVPKATNLRAISKQTGLVSWTITLPYSEILYLGESGENLTIVSSEGEITVAKKVGGLILSQNSLHAKVLSAPFFTPRSVSLIVDLNEILVFSLLEGKILFRQPSSIPPAALYLYQDKTLIWGDTKGNLFAVDISTNRRIWKFKNGARISGITPVGSSMLVTSYDNFIYNMVPEDGEIAWKRRFSGRLLDKPVAGPNFLLISVLGEPGISFVDLSTGKPLNRLPFGADDELFGSPISVMDTVVFSKNGGIFSYSTVPCLKTEKRDE